MINLERIRADSEAAARLVARLADATILHRLDKLDAEHRNRARRVDELRSRRRTIANEVAHAAAGAAESARELGRRVSEELVAAEAELSTAAAELREMWLALPNVPHGSVPVGADSAANRVERTWGEPRLPISNPLPHWDIAKLLGLDLERGSRLSGSRFYFLTDDLARLEIALIQFKLDMHVRLHGYRLVIPPYLVSERAMEICGQLPKFGDGLYKIERDGLFLVPTAESALASMHQEETLPSGDLPLRYVGFSPCFRRESGAAGSDTRGVLRVHQFHKVELFQFVEPADSYAQLEELVQHAEAVLQRLQLPYRVVSLCTGDLGFAAAKTYDLEVWLPGQGTYREISSCSNVEDFQARRANTRYRHPRTNKPVLVHMLNGSGLAVGRTMVALIENYQQEGGSVAIPEALRGYMGGQEVMYPREKGTILGT